MKSFSQFTLEAWTNEIGKESKEISVTNNNKYNSPTDFKSNAKKVGQIGPLEIHSSENSQGGMTHFTWSPQDRKIHHVVHAVESSKTPEGDTQLKYLSAHKREGSPISMGQVYSHLVKNNNVQFVGTGHSPGAQKMWNRFHDDPELQVVGQHPSGETVNLNKGGTMYASKKATDPDEKRVGRMSLILRKRP
jgi:hypothetical protein